MADTPRAAWAHVVRLAAGAKNRRGKRNLTIGTRVYELHFWALDDEDRLALPNLAERLTLRRRAVVRTAVKGADVDELRTVAAGIWDLIGVGGTLAHYRNAAVWPTEPTTTGPWLTMQWSIHDFAPLIGAVRAVEAAADEATVVLGVP